MYFIDNEDYFQRKYVFTDENGKFFDDNGERAVFFARGVLETVKKLRWKPDIIHCQGWISHILPLYLKKCYKDDPIFSNTKVVLSLYDEFLEERFSADLAEKAALPGLESKDFELFAEPVGINLAKLASFHSDGIIMGSDSIPAELEGFCKELGRPVLPYFKIENGNNDYIKVYNDFYDRIIGNTNEDNAQ